jgi:hypothetical protein
MAYTVVWYIVQWCCDVCMCGLVRVMRCVVVCGIVWHGDACTPPWVEIQVGIWCCVVYPVVCFCIVAWWTMYSDVHCYVVLCGKGIPFLGGGTGGWCTICSVVWCGVVLRCGAVYVLCCVVVLCGIVWSGNELHLSLQRYRWGSM